MNGIFIVVLTCFIMLQLQGMIYYMSLRYRPVTVAQSLAYSISPYWHNNSRSVLYIISYKYYAGACIYVYDTTLL